MGFALATLFPPDLALAGTSVYTDLDTDHCRSMAKLDADDGPADFVSLRCKGYRDFPVYYAEGDMRQSLHFGYLSQAIVDQEFETFGPFNYAGRKIEWRLGADGRPYAAILRFFIQNANPDTGMVDKNSEGQVLVISRVGQPNDKRGCVVGYVDARKNADPNGMARQVADGMALSFDCGKLRPVFHGAKTDPGNDPSVNFPGLE
jgi:hypothetical protein